MRRWQTSLRVLWAASLAVLLVDAVLSRRWGWVAAVLALGAVALVLHRRAPQRPAAPADWSCEQVRAVLDDQGGRHVAAVKALRTADPGLSLVEADRLVRECAER